MSDDRFFTPPEFSEGEHREEEITDPVSDPAPEQDIDEYDETDEETSVVLREEADFAAEENKEDPAAGEEYRGTVSSMDGSEDRQEEAAESVNKENTEPLPPRYGYYRVQDREREEGPAGTSRETRPAPVTGNAGGSHSSGSSFFKKLALGIFMAALFGFVAAVVFRLVSPMLSSSDVRTTARVESADTVPERSLESTDTISESGAENASAVNRTDEKKEDAEEGLLRTAETSDDVAESSAGFVSTGKGNVADVASASMPSIVAITSVSIQEFSDFWGYRRQYASEGSGSGIIVGENEDELLIATNNHVIAGTSTLQVFFYGDDVQVDPEATNSRNRYGFDEEKAVAAVVKGSDTENDLAVIAVKKADIPAETLQKVRIAVLGSSDDLVVGEQVVAIGNALGYGQSVTSGWVSALGRTIVNEDGTVTHLIQTDAAINPGNSGGALLNLKGEVIGINTAKYADYAVEGMGYAIPISNATPILEDMMNRETREKLSKEESGYMGVSLVDLSDKMLQMYNMPAGAFVEEVYIDSPAADAGLKRGDIIMKIDGQTVSNGSAVIDLLQYYAPGETVDVVVARSDAGEYRQSTLSVTLGERPYN